MSFFKSIFGNDNELRRNLRRYVEMEFAPEEREAAFERLLNEANRRA